MGSLDNKMDICVFSARTNTVTQLIIKPTKIMKIFKLKLKLLADILNQCQQNIGYLLNHVNRIQAIF